VPPGLRLLVDDWSGYAAGDHAIAARAVAQDGRTLNSTLRRFVVDGRR